MPQIPSLDFVLLETSIFGVNQGYTGRFISPRIAWALQIFNLCYSVTMTSLLCSGEYFYTSPNDQPSINYNNARKVYYCQASVMTMFIQIRYLLRRQKMAPVGRELCRLYNLSTWNGYIYGCIARIVHFLGWHMLYHCLPMYATRWDGRMGWRIVHILQIWVNFVPTVTTEFIGQAMLLFQHEVEELRQISRGMTTRKDFRIEKLRRLNRRHASLFALFDRVARFTGIDSLLIIESEIILILTALFIRVNLYTLFSLHWSKTLIIDSALYAYRLDRVTRQCFRGHRIIMAAKRFASTLDAIDPLHLENDEIFIELQIIRKQVKLRNLQYDCNRFLKLDMKRILHVLKDILSLILILVQLTTDFSTGISKGGNMTMADNVTEHFFGFSDIEENAAEQRT